MLELNKVKTRKKNNKLFISIVALFNILLITSLTVFAWTETTSSLQIIGNGNIDDFTYTGAEIGSGSGYDNTPIDLTDYIRESGNLHFAEVSSANGTDFFFPKLDSTTKTEANVAPAYRKGTINDKNVGYISFSLDIKSVDADKDYMFEQVPVITIGGTPVEDNKIRVAITEGTSTKIYSHNSSTSEHVISAEDATTSATTVNAFKDYLSDGVNSLFSISKGATKRITITIWLQFDATSSEYAGQDVEIKNFKIVPTYTGAVINVHYNTAMCTAAAVYDGKESTKLRVPAGKTVNLKSVALNSNGYNIVGWYSGTDNTGEFKANTQDYSFTIPTNYESSYDFYVEYEVASYRVSAVSMTDGYYMNDGGTVTLAVDGVAQAGATKKVEYDTEYMFTATANEGYAFMGWYDNSTNGTQINDSRVNGNVFTVSSADKNLQIFAYFQCDTKYVYLKTTSDWETDNARFAAYFFIDDDNYKWVNLTAVVKDSIYRCAVPTDKEYSKFIFVRMNPANTANNWNNKWNQTQDLDVPNSNYQMRTITGYDSCSTVFTNYYKNITFVDSTDTKWVDNDNARLFVKDTSTKTEYEMAHGTDGWIASVPDNVSNVQFIRKSFKLDTEYNSWDAGSVTSSKYTATGSGTGNWQ